MKRINRKTQPSGSIYSNELMLGVFEDKFSSLYCNEEVNCETMESNFESETGAIIPCQDEQGQSIEGVKVDLFP